MNTVGKATYSLFDTDDSRLALHKTFLVLGVRRGGTTATAGVVSKLGVDLGPARGNNLEDQRFRKQTGSDGLRALVAQRNAEKDVWGWKNPRPLVYLDEIRAVLRNLRMIAVTRDPTATALRASKGKSDELIEAARAAVRVTQSTLSYVEKHQIPTLFVSYEKLLQAPQEAIAEIAHFAGVDAGAERCSEIAKFVQPGGYLDAKEWQKDAPG